MQSSAVMPELRTWADAAPESFLRWCSEQREDGSCQLLSLRVGRSKREGGDERTQEGPSGVARPGVVERAVHALEGGRLVDGHAGRAVLVLEGDARVLDGCAAASKKRRVSPSVGGKGEESSGLSAEDVPFGRKRPVSLVARQGERGRRFLWVERAACEGVCHRVKCEDVVGSQTRELGAGDPSLEEGVLALDDNPRSCP